MNASPYPLSAEFRRTFPLTSAEYDDPPHQLAKCHFCGEPIIDDTHNPFCSRQCSHDEHYAFTGQCLDCGYEPCVCR